MSVARQVRVTRRRDALEGQTLQVLGRLRRHGGVELLVVLPDGSKRLIPQGWTDADLAGGDPDGQQVATLGSLSDLLAAWVLASALSTRGSGAQGQAARQSPCEEDDRAACAAQSAAGPVSGATHNDVGPASPAAGRRGDRAAGRSDRQGGDGRGRRR